MQGQKGGPLDFLSEAFDASLALQTPGLQPPDESAVPLDNVSKCRLLLPLEMPESLVGKKQRKGAETTRHKHESFREKALANIQRIEERTNTSLQSVMDLADNLGPISKLRTWQQARCRVRVDTRHASGRRGTAEGLLIAYDRYMNLILLDVVENYTILIKVPRVKPKLPKHGTDSTQETQPIEQIRWVNKQDHRQRSLGQVFIKGDNVISISCESPLPKIQEETQGSPSGD